MDSAMFGFAKSPDGITYFAGSGLPEHGIYRSTDRGEHFERVSNHGVLCLHDAPGGRLFVCENPLTLGGPGIALSTDQGKTVTAIAAFGDVKGPVVCDSDASCDARCRRRPLRGRMAGDARVGSSSRRGREEGRGGGRRRDASRAASPHADRAADARSSAPSKMPRIAVGSPRGYCPSWCGDGPAGAVDQRAPRVVHHGPRDGQAAHDRGGTFLCEVHGFGDFVGDVAQVLARALSSHNVSVRGSFPIRSWRQVCTNQ